MYSDEYTWWNTRALKGAALVRCNRWADPWVGGRVSLHLDAQWLRGPAGSAEHGPAGSAEF